MKIQAIPYTIEYLLNKKQNQENIKVFNERAGLNRYLIEKGYIQKVTERNESGFLVYKSTELFNISTVDEILLEMTQLTLEEYKKVRFIKFKDLHVNSSKQFIKVIKSIMNAKEETAVEVESHELTSILIMHGLAARGGSKRDKTYGTEKLNEFIKTKENYQDLFKLLTGEYFYSFYHTMKARKEQKDFYRLKKLANQYNFTLVKN